MDVLCHDPRNRKILPSEKGISRCGYIGKGLNEFAPYSDQYLYTGRPDMKRLFDSIRLQGGDGIRQIEYFNQIRKASGRVVKIAIAAALASPILKPLRLKPFVVYIMGGKDIGKSKVLSLVASMWGEPDAYVCNLSSTKVGAEILAGFLHSLPLCLDELMTIENRQSLASLIYMLGQGKGKTRANRNCELRATPEWFCSTLMSGERQPLNGNDWAGAEARTLLLDAGDEPLFEDFVELVREIHINYGWIGKQFIELLAKLGLFDRIELLYTKYLKAFSDRGYKGKQAGSAAVCLVADALASKCIFRDADASLRLTVDDLIVYLADPKETEMGLRMVRWLKGWIARNNNHFIRPATAPAPGYAHFQNDEYVPATVYIRIKGTLDEQINFFNQLRRDFPAIVRLPIAASLSAPLVKAFELDGFTFDIVGGAGVGKSTLLELCASICQEPESTIRRGQPLEAERPPLSFLDDAMPGQAGSDSGVCVMASERPVADEDSNADVFTMDLADTAEFKEMAPAVRRFVAEHYGQIGQEFMRVVNDEGHWDEAQKLLEGFKERFRGRGLSEKQAACFAACLTADTLACEYVFKDEDPGLRLTVEDF